MNLEKYCRDNKFTLPEYQDLKRNLKVTAIEILMNIKALHKVDTGVYYSVDEIIDNTWINDYKNFLIIELKKLDVEFYDNNTYYRY